MAKGFDKMKLPAFMPGKTATEDKAPVDLTLDGLVQKVPELVEEYVCPFCGGTHRRVRVSKG